MRSCSAGSRSNGAKVLAGDPAARTHAIAAAVAGKARIVEEDERETSGRRALLNLGHTFGHALEAETGYSDRLLHGEAVALGCVLAFAFSAERGLCSAGDAERVRAHFRVRRAADLLSPSLGCRGRASSLPRTCSTTRSASAGRTAFILVRGIGEAFVDKSVELCRRRGVPRPRRLMIFAEVIGDPIAQSKSPLIHKYWLDRLGIAGDYRADAGAADELASFLDRRRSDPDWRGCNVTIPHKQSGHPVARPARCRRRSDRRGQLRGARGRCARRLQHRHRRCRGGAGFRRSCADARRRSSAREEPRGRSLPIWPAAASAALPSSCATRNERRRCGRLLPAFAWTSCNFDCADAAFGGAAAIINASPLGMAGADPMPQSLLEAVRSHAAAATVFDLVTTPAETEFLSSGANGRRASGRWPHHACRPGSRCVRAVLRRAGASAGRSAA